MDAEVIRNTLAALAAEEERLVDAIKRADVRLAQVRSAITALTALETDQPPEFDGKLADAIRTILKKFPNALSPVEVRDEVKAIGYDLAKHTNAMATIHGVLKRLAETKDVKAKELKDGTRYYWVGEPRRTRTFADFVQPRTIENIADITAKYQRAVGQIGSNPIFDQADKINEAIEQMNRVVANLPKFTK